MSNFKIFYCNFCGKSSEEARRLIAGGGVFICDECTLLAYEIVSKADDGDIEFESWQSVRLNG